MKKYFIFAAIAAAGLLTSCSSDDNIAGENAPAIVDNDNVREAIKLGIGATTEVTRGQGTVGDIAGQDGNVWKGEKINIFMFKKGTLLLSKTTDPDISTYPAPIYNNTLMTTPNGNASGLALEVLPGNETPDGRVKLRYYPIEKYVDQDELHDNRKADFWGYFIDDAAVDNEGAPVAIGVPTGVDDEDATQVTVPFIIDGSQDLMTAKTKALGDEQIAALGEGENAGNYFSAYAARRDIQPELVFNHELTRLIFEFEGGTATTCGWNNVNSVWENSNAEGKTFTGVFVKSIKLKSNTKGKMIVAYTAAPENGNIVWDEDPLETQLSVWGPLDNGTEATDAVLYTDDTAYDHNLGLDGVRKTTDVKTPASKYTAETATAHNAELDGHVSAGEGAPADFETKVGSAATGATLTVEEAIAYNKATLEGAVDTDDDDPTTAVYYTKAECNEYNKANVEGAVKAGDVQTPAQPATEGTGKLLPLYNSEIFPSINPADDGYNLATVNTSWGAALAYGSANYSKVYKLTASAATSNTEFTAVPLIVGSPLLVEPRAKYNIEIELGQYLKDKDKNGTELDDEYFVRYIPVTLENVTIDGGFLKGTSYKIKVKVYGSEKIDVTTTLTGWTDGGNKTVDSEEFGY